MESTADSCGGRLQHRRLPKSATAPSVKQAVRYSLRTAFARVRASGLSDERAKSAKHLRNRKEAEVEATRSR